MGFLYSILGGWRTALSLLGWRTTLSLIGLSLVG
jgi:hypothetical protein